MWGRMWDTLHVQIAKYPSTAPSGQVLDRRYVRITINSAG